MTDIGGPRWFDAEKGRLVYNIEDSDYAATGGLGARDMDSEVDASQVSEHPGYEGSSAGGNGGYCSDACPSLGDKITFWFRGKTFGRSV